MAKKGTGNWKPLPKDPGPGFLQGESPKAEPILPDPAFEEEGLTQVPISTPVKVPTEIGGGSNVRKKK